VSIELLGKLRQRSIALDGGKRLRLEDRCVVPARSSLPVTINFVFCCMPFARAETSKWGAAKYSKTSIASTKRHMSG
jgi:hypothetical protein